MDKQDLIDKLSKLGLDSKETEIINHLLSTHNVRITELSKELGVARTSVYRYLEKLEKEGWIEYVMDNKGKLIKLADLNAIKDKLEDEKDRIEESEKVIEEMMEMAPVESSDDKRKIIYYEGKSGIKQMHWNMFRSKGEIMVMTSLTTRELLGEGKWFDRLIMEHTSKGIKFRSLVDLEYYTEFKKKYPDTDTYYKPVTEFKSHIDKRVYKQKDFNLKGKIAIYNNIVGLMSIENNKMIGTEIESEQLSSTFRSIFEGLWSQTSSDDRF